MAGLAVGDEADQVARVGLAGLQEVAQDFGAEMGLIAEGDDEMREGRIVDGERGGGDDGAHHAAREVGGGNAFGGGDFEAVEFLHDGGVGCLRMNDEKSDCADLAPLGEEMAEDGGLAPGQAEFRRTHATGFAGGEDGDESRGHEGEYRRWWCGCSGKSFGNPIFCPARIMRGRR